MYDTPMRPIEDIEAYYNEQYELIQLKAKQAVDALVSYIETGHGMYSNAYRQWQGDALLASWRAKEAKRIAKGVFKNEGDADAISDLEQQFEEVQAVTELSQIRDWGREAVLRANLFHIPYVEPKPLIETTYAERLAKGEQG